VLPLVIVLLLNISVGTKLNGLALGLVNNEVANYSDCFNSSLEAVKVHRRECSLKLFSCRFIGELNQNVMELVRICSWFSSISNDISLQKFYDSTEEALRDLKMAKLKGFLQINSNFTSSFSTSRQDIIEPIQVFLDNSFKHQAGFIKKELYETYFRFANRMKEECKDLLNIKTSSFDVEAVHGKIDYNVTKEICLGIVCL
jgi:hypothetical protein